MQQSENCSPETLLGPDREDSARSDRQGQGHFAPMKADPAWVIARLDTIKDSQAQFERLVVRPKVQPETLGEQAGYIAALWRQLADYYRNECRE
jgi:hypothetical protein